MTKALYIFSFLILAHFTSFSQNSVNDYKYIIIPNRFDFLKEKDQYQINSIAKFLFNKYGYTAFMQDEKLPEDLYSNKCLGLTADVVKQSAFLQTKLRIDLIDCNGNIIESSKIGQTREKEYAKAYNIALRNAFETFQYSGYKYKPNAEILAKSTSNATSSSNVNEQEEITRLKEEIKSLKDDKVEATAVIPATTAVVVSKEINKEEVPKEKAASKLDTKELKSTVLYAQAIENGFQVVDSTPKVVMILLPTGAKDVFSVKDKNAIVFKKDNQWIYSENDGKDVKESILQLKF